MLKVGSHSSGDFQAAEEAANTWWAIVIVEQIISCDVTVPEQPLVTNFPSGDARLPTEPQIFDQGDLLDVTSIPNVLISSPITVDVGGFGRTAQAANLMDQVLECLSRPDIEGRLAQLNELDAALQAFLAFLALSMQQHQGKTSTFCTGVSIGIRALFILHRYTVKLPPQYELWTKSHAALGTVTKMVMDIAEAHEAVPPHLVDRLPPSNPYLMRATLRHIHSSAKCKDDEWLQKVDERLRAGLLRFNKRWTVDVL